MVAYEQSGRERLLQEVWGERRWEDVVPEQQHQGLVLGSPVRFGFSSIFGKTETETGPSWLKILKTETETVRDRFTAVLHVFLRLRDRSDRLWFRPVYNRS